VQLDTTPPSPLPERTEDVVVAIVGVQPNSMSTFTDRAEDIDA
jgi:hypothetical protein